MNRCLVLFWFGYIYGHLCHVPVCLPIFCLPVCLPAGFLLRVDLLVVVVFLCALPCAILYFCVFVYALTYLCLGYKTVRQRVSFYFCHHLKSLGGSLRSASLFRESFRCSFPLSVKASEYILEKQLIDIFSGTKWSTSYTEYTFST